MRRPLAAMGVCGWAFLAACGGITAGSQSAGDGGNGSGSGGGNDPGSDRTGLWVQGVLYPTPVPQGQVCTFTPSPQDQMLMSGTLDVALRQIYLPTLLVGYRPDASHQGSDLDLQGGVVSVQDQGGTHLTSFTTLASNSVYAGGGTSSTVGSAPYRVTTVQMLDSSTSKSIPGGVAPGHDGQLTISIKVFGHLTDGTYLESPPFAFPLRVCDGCLITFPPSEMNPQLPQPNCANGSPQGDTSLVPCFTGQDTPIDCALCLSVPACNGGG